MNSSRSSDTRRDFRVDVPESTRRAVMRASVRFNGVRALGKHLRVGDTTIYDAIAPMGIMRRELLERVQSGLRALGEHP